MSLPGASTRRLDRDRLTVAFYATFVTWGWYLYAFSPAVPLIAEEQGISRGEAGLHGTAMAMGTIATGMFSSVVAVRFGRKVQSLAGGGTIVVGILMLISGTTLAMTLPACFVISIGGGLTISAAQPGLSVHHGAAGPAAVTEANAMGATFGLLAPLALGASVGLGWGWRPAVAVVVVLAVVAGLLLAPLRATGGLGRGTPLRRSAPPAPVAGAVEHAPRPGRISARPAAAGRSTRFHPTFPLFLAAMICGVAIEFATTFWAPELLRDRTGAPDSVATASVSALVAGMSISRYVVGPLSMRKAPEKLLIVAYVVAGLGWLVFWLTSSPWVAVGGLVLAGFGYGAHYPLSVSLVLRSSEGRPDQAQARASIGTGMAVAVSPFLLGSLADQFGAHSAFLLVPVLIVAGGTAVALGLRTVHRHAPATAPADT